MKHSVQIEKYELKAADEQNENKILTSIWQKYTISYIIAYL